jgi:hypothetical protein
VIDVAVTACEPVVNTEFKEAAELLVTANELNRFALAALVPTIPAKLTAPVTAVTVSAKAPFVVEFTVRLPPPVAMVILPVRVTARFRVTEPPAVVIEPAVLRVPVPVTPKLTADAPVAVMVPAADTVVVPAESREIVPLAVVMA